MPYQTINDLPDDIRNRLNEEEQKLFIKVFNSVLEQTGDEEQAFAIANNSVNEMKKNKTIKKMNKEQNMLFEVIKKKTTYHEQRIYLALFNFLYDDYDNKNNLINISLEILKKISKIIPENYIYFDLFFFLFKFIYKNSDDLNSAVDKTIIYFNDISKIIKNDDDFYMFMDLIYNLIDRNETIENAIKLAKTTISKLNNKGFSLDDIPKKFKKIVNSLSKKLQDTFIKVYQETKDGQKAIEAVNTIQKMYKEHKIFGEFKIIEKKDNFIIAGIATTEKLDTDQEIVDKQTVIEFIQDFFKSGAPLCNRHKKNEVVGKVVTANYLSGDDLEEFCNKHNIPLPSNKTGLCVIAEVFDKNIKNDIIKGILKTFSVGLTGLKKVGKRLFAKIHELSVVEFPANIECNFNVVKMLKSDLETNDKDKIIDNKKSEIKPDNNTKDIIEKKSKKNKGVYKMKLNDKQVKMARLLGMDIDKELNENDIELIDLKIEKEETERKAEIEKAKTEAIKEAKEKFEKELKEKEEKELKEKAEKEIKELKEKAEKLEIEKDKFEKATKEELEKMITEKEEANKTNENIKDISNAKDKGNKLMNIDINKHLVESNDIEEVINKGFKEHIYDITKFNKNRKVKIGDAEASEYIMNKCRIYAKEVLTKLDKNGIVDFDEIKVKFVNKSALANNSSTTGNVLTQETFSDFIVDEPLREHPVLMALASEICNDDSFDVKRRTGRGKAIPGRDDRSFSAKHSTLVKETVKLKEIVYQGGVSKKLQAMSRIDAMAEEIYNSKEAHDDMLETMILLGTKEMADIEGTKEGEIFKGMMLYANDFGKNAVIDKQGIALTTATIDKDIFARYRKNSRLLNPSMVVSDVMLKGTINNLLRADKRIVQGDINVDGGINVDVINRVPHIDSFSLCSDEVAPTNALSNVAGGSITGTVYVQVASIDKTGITVKSTEQSQVLSSEKLKISITNREEDYAYAIYLNDSTGNTYLYKIIEKDPDNSTTDLTITSISSYPTYNEGRIAETDRIMVLYSNNVAKGCKLRPNKKGEFRLVTGDGTKVSDDNFEIVSYIALEVKSSSSLMVAFLKE